jgi:hypothetical protein
MPRTRQDFGYTRKRVCAWRSLEIEGDWPKARLAERRDCEPRSGEGVWGAQLPALLKNIT